GIDHFIEKVIYGRYMEKSYISSFCTHSQHGKYIMENGLLSMWKGPGKSNSRIAIIFDGDLLENNFDCFLKGKGAAYIGDMVIYNKYQDKTFKHLQPYFNEIKNFFNSLMRGPEEAKRYIEDEGVKISKSVLNTLSRIKHQGFEEEDEYRFGIINVPDNKNENRSNPFDEHLDEDGRRYITLELNLLPTINTIIIGPGKDQKEIEGRINLLIDRLSEDINVKCSDTPYTDL
ncbi:MAG: DUF2971 domain-containing protein, partial [Gammaproteobacteria bacterium]